MTKPYRYLPLVILPWAAGCNSLAAYERSRFSAPLAQELELEVRQTERVFGESVAGRPIRATILGSGPDVVFILASIHGTEPAGTPIVERLLVHLRESPRRLEGKTLVALPVANPDGFVRGSRHNDRGVDLNRNFPASNRQERDRFGPTGLSEPESRAIDAILSEFPPSRVLSIHQPLACVDYDGPAGALAERMAEVCELDVKKLGSRPGSLGSYVGVDLRVPIVTLELRGGDQTESPSELWRRYGASLLAFVDGTP